MLPAKAGAVASALAYDFESPRRKQRRNIPKPRRTAGLRPEQKGTCQRHAPPGGFNRGHTRTVNTRSQDVAGFLNKSLFPRGLGSTSEAHCARWAWSGRGFCCRSPKICHGSSCTTALPGACRGGGDLKVTPEVVERIKRLRRLGRRAADIARLCGLSEPTVRKVLKRATTKESPTETQETWTEVNTGG